MNCYSILITELVIFFVLIYRPLSFSLRSLIKFNVNLILTFQHYSKCLNTNWKYLFQPTTVSCHYEYCCFRTRMCPDYSFNSWTIGIYQIRSFVVQVFCNQVFCNQVFCIQVCVFRSFVFQVFCILGLLYLGLCIQVCVFRSFVIRSFVFRLFVI